MSAAPAAVGSPSPDRVSEPALKFPHVDYSALPEHIRDGARLYVEHGIAPGSFTTAVISNDLREAFARADDINRARMFDIVCWFYNEAPSQCWGSAQMMNQWIAARAEEDRGAA